MTATKTDTTWASLRVRTSTVLALKRLTTVLREKYPTATLDSILAAAIDYYRKENRISAEFLAKVRVPKDGRAAGAQARSVRTSEGSED